MKQKTLFANDETPIAGSSTFSRNMSRPVHRWFRYSAGFSAEWAEDVISKAGDEAAVRVLDPFAGSGTTLLAAQSRGVSSIGVESHPFVARIARAKLACQSDPARYVDFARRVLESARSSDPVPTDRPELLTKCYQNETLESLERLRAALEAVLDSSPEFELTWLTLVSILRSCSHVGTAQWQYVLPNKTKRNPLDPFDAFAHTTRMFHSDMLEWQKRQLGPVSLIQGDARQCRGVPEGFATLVITSPPYPNNYDYADATRLEMTFMGEISGWGDLQESVRKHLVRSCSQHVPEKAVQLDPILASVELQPIQQEISEVCRQLAEIRKTKGGKKTYHLMVASYFYDLAQVWKSLRRSCDSPSRVCFVVGDSAPYGVYVPVMKWMEILADSAGFKTNRFVKLRDRNVKWKNRKHRVPLCEGELWVDG